MTFEQIKFYYDNKLWSKQRVAMAVRLGVITEDQYKEITGEVYSK